MARIYINSQKAGKVVQSEAELSRFLHSLSQDVYDIRGNLRYKIAGREQISARLRQAAEQIERESNSAAALSTGLQQATMMYQKTESENRKRRPTELVLIRTSVSQLIKTKPTWPRPGWNLPFIPLPDAWNFPVSIGITSLVGYLAQQDGEAFDSNIFSWKSVDGLSSHESSVISKTKWDVIKAGKDKDGSVAESVNNWKKKHTKNFSDSGKYYIDGKIGKISKIDPKDTEAVKEFSEHNRGKFPIDVRVAGVGTSETFRVAGGNGELSGSVGGVSGSWDFLKAEYSADAYAGVLGVGAAIGGSVSLLTVEGSTYLGTDDMQVYLNGSATAGRIGAAVEGSVGLIDKNGDFNPSAYVSASAELIAGEVSGSVGGKIAGTDISATASVNFGIGAHANVGVHDGKISVDVGASLGPGVSIKLDIDVSGTVKAISQSADKVKSFLKKIF